MGYALRCLPANEMGLWYVMSAIVGWASFVELGFGSTISRFASYYLGGSRSVQAIGLDAQLSDSTANYAAIAGLIHTARILYRRFGFFLILLALSLGLFWIVLRISPSEVPNRMITWFIVLAIGSGMNMAGQFWGNILFGLNEVRAYNQTLVLGLLLNYLAAYGGLLAGLGIGALVAGQLILNFAPRCLAYLQVRTLIPAADEKKTNWRDLWPTAWKTGVGSFAAFVYLQGTTLTCSILTDAATTASYGLTMQIALMLGGIAGSWLAVKYPEISQLQACGALAQLRKLVRRRMLMALLTYAAGTLTAVILLPFVMRFIRSQTPLLPPAQMIFLFILVGLELVIGMHVAVIQTGNKVSYLPAFVFSGILTIVLTLLLNAWAGTLGVWSVLLPPFMAQSIFNYWHTPWLCWRGLKPCATATPHRPSC